MKPQLTEEEIVEKQCWSCSHLTYNNKYGYVCELHGFRFSAPKHIPEGFTKASVIDLRNHVCNDWEEKALQVKGSVL